MEVECVESGRMKIYAFGLQDQIALQGNGLNLYSTSLVGDAYLPASSPSTGYYYSFHFVLQEIFWHDGNVLYP